MMKKLLSGFVFGLTMAIAIPVLASNMVGKKIDNVYPIVIDGNRLSKDAIVIEGTSYLPVRVMAEFVGHNVYFENNQVILKRKVGLDLTVPETGQTNIPPLVGQQQTISTGSYNLISQVPGPYFSILKNKIIVQNGECYLSALTFINAAQSPFNKNRDKIQASASEPDGTTPEGGIYFKRITIELINGEKLDFYKNRIDNDNVIIDTDTNSRYDDERYFVKLSALGLKLVPKADDPKTLYLQNL